MHYAWKIMIDAPQLEKFSLNSYITLHNEPSNFWHQPCISPFLMVSVAQGIIVLSVSLTNHHPPTCTKWKKIVFVEFVNFCKGPLSCHLSVCFTCFCLSLWVCLGWGWRTCVLGNDWVNTQCLMGGLYSPILVLCSSFMLCLWCQHLSTS